MDSIKKLEQINSKNELLFEGIFGKKPASTDLMLSAQGGGYILNGNYIKRFNIEGSPNFNFIDNNTWTSPEYSWLTNAKFQATFILVRNYEVHFSGVWEDGDFKGREFFGDNSAFNGGSFHGTAYNAPNVLFNSQKRINPEHYFTGTYKDNKNGILGTNNLTVSQINNINQFSLIEISVGWGVELTDSYGKKLTFEVVKRLDEKGTEYIFRTIPDRKLVTVPWEVIRGDYLNRGIVVIGKGFGLFDGVDFGKVAKILITTEPSMSISTKGIRLSSVPIEKLLKKYGGIDLSFEIQPKSDNAKKFVSTFLNDISNGNFEELLMSLNAKVKSGQITGYNNFEFLAPVFGKIAGNDKLDSATREQLQYLNNVVGYVGNSVPENIKKIIIKVLKNSIGFVAKRPVKPQEVPPEGVLAPGDTEKTEKSEKDKFGAAVSKAKSQI